MLGQLRDSPGPRRSTRSCLRAVHTSSWALQCDWLHIPAPGRVIRAARRGFWNLTQVLHAEMLGQQEGLNMPPFPLPKTKFKTLQVLPQVAQLQSQHLPSDIRAFGDQFMEAAWKAWSMSGPENIGTMQPTSGETWTWRSAPLGSFATGRYLEKASCCYEKGPKQHHSALLQLRQKVPAPRFRGALTCHAPCNSYLYRDMAAALASPVRRGAFPARAPTPQWDCSRR